MLNLLSPRSLFCFLFNCKNLVWFISPLPDAVVRGHVGALDVEHKVLDQSVVLICAGHFFLHVSTLVIPLFLPVFLLKISFIRIVKPGLFSVRFMIIKLYIIIERYILFVTIWFLYKGHFVQSKDDLKPTCSHLKCIQSWINVLMIDDF